ncbi:MAG: hypothetical protein HKP17_05030, partial [Ignavibacteriaceae bacterium]|nr:hypothetical protein [Ignavibacteria bacterium]NNJ52512.1 hypothetical protein [Ignavibacteriaceae bacterium]
NPRAEEFGFELIDNLKVDSNLVLKFKEIYSDRIKEKELTKLLRNVPQLLLLPLVLKEVANLSYRTIAEFIDVPDGVISTRIYRARKLIFIKLLILDFEESNSVSEKSDLIFKLRVTAELLDNELPSSEKDASEEKIKTDPRLKKEYEVQELVKKVLKNSFVTKTSPERLKQKIKKKAESSFSVKI